MGMGIGEGEGCSSSSSSCLHSFLLINNKHM